jgi:hypothetical protein
MDVIPFNQKYFWSVACGMVAAAENTYNNMHLRGDAVPIYLYLILAKSYCFLGNNDTTTVRVLCGLMTTCKPKLV